MYSPKIREDLIKKLYKKAKALNIPMTRYVNHIIDSHFKELDKLINSVVKGDK